MILVANLSCQETEQGSRYFTIDVEDILLEVAFSVLLIFSDTSCCLAELRHLRKWAG